MEERQDLNTPQDREQDRLDTKRVRAFKDLVRMEGWKYFQELLNKKVEENTADIFEKPTSVNARGEDWQKGLCYGLLWARDLPNVTIAAFKDEASEPAEEETEL